jgi:histidine triad (HIT) family protein
MSKKPFSVFSQIVKKEIPATIRYEDDFFIAFDNISPEAPVHILIVPKENLDCLEDVEIGNLEFMGKILQVARKVAKLMKIEKNYKLTMNVGKKMQDVHHIHLHLMGGFK